MSVKDFFSLPAVESFITSTACKPRPSDRPGVQGTELEDFSLVALRTKSLEVVEKLKVISTLIDFMTLVKKPIKEDEPYWKYQHSQVPVNKLYSFFKNHCLFSDISPQNPDYITEAKLTAQFILAESKKLNLHQEAIAPALQKFNEMVFNDLIKSYADQPLDQITPESLKERVKVIARFFPLSEFVEMELREAVESKHKTKLRF